MATYRVPIILSWTGTTGSPGVNVWHIRTAPATTETAAVQDQLNMLHKFYTEVAHPASGLLADELYANNVTISLGEIVDVATKEYKTGQTWTPITTTSGEQAPPMCMVVVGWRTSLAARRGRGRTFMGPMNKAALQADGTPVAGVVTTLQKAADTLVADSAAVGTGAIGIYGLQDEAPPGYWDNPANNGSELPHVLRDITGARVRDRIAVLRSRRD